MQEVQRQISWSFQNENRENDTDNLPKNTKKPLPKRNIPITKACLMPTIMKEKRTTGEHITGTISKQKR